MESAARALASGARVMASASRALASPLSKVDSKPFRSYSSYYKTKSGLWVPAPVAPKASRSEQVMSFIKNRWKGIDKSVRLMIVEFLTKSALYTFTGGGGMFLMKSTLDRLGKLEAHVAESDKELEKLKIQVQMESEYSEEQFGKFDQASHEKYLEITSALNELKLIRDIWLSSAYNENMLSPKEEPAKKPAPKHMAAIAKDVSKKGNQETTSDKSRSDDALSDDDEPAKKPAPKHMAAIAKDGSKKGKQETTNDESNSDDALSYDDESNEEVRVLFELIDKDNDGYISLPELDDLFARLNEAGFDVKGQISLQELLNLIGK